mgnify:CR=1 FL=1
MIKERRAKLTRKIILILTLLIFFCIIFNSYVLSGEKIKISGIEIQGNRNIPKEEIIKTLDLPEEIDEDIVRSGLQRLLNTGYFSNIDARIKVDGSKYILVISVSEAPAFKEIKVVGNKDIDTAEIANLISLKSGTTINLITLNQDLGKIAELYKSRGYIGANFQVNITEDGIIVININ